MKLWNNYKLYITSNHLTSKHSISDGLPYWQEILFINIMLFLMPISILIYIPSVVISIMHDLIVIAVFDTAAVLILLIILLNNKISMNCKKFLFLFNLYALAIILVVFIGTKGSGAVYLMGVSILAILIISPKAGYISVGINFLIYCFLISCFFIPNFFTPFVSQYSLYEWTAVAVNLVGLNIVIVFSIQSLINGLVKSIKNEKVLREQLVMASRELLKAKVLAEGSEQNLRGLKDKLEIKVKERTMELNEKVSELEHFHDATIDREFRMKELRDEIAELKKNMEE